MQILGLHKERGSKYQKYLSTFFTRKTLKLTLNFIVLKLFVLLDVFNVWFGRTA